MLSFLLKGGKLASKIMLMTLLGKEKAKALMKHVNKKEKEKDKEKDKEKPKQKKLNLDEIKKILR